MKHKLFANNLLTVFGFWHFSYLLFEIKKMKNHCIGINNWKDIRALFMKKGKFIKLRLRES